MRLVSLIIILCVTYFVQAQNSMTPIQYVNEIKSQNDEYYWEQYTHYNPDTAKVNATKQLLSCINSQTDNLTLLLEDIIPQVNYINIQRGKSTQCFVYVKKNEVNRTTSITTTSSATELNNNSITPNNRNTQSSFVPDMFVQRIMEINNFHDVYNYLKSLQNQGKILQFGKLKDVEEYNSLDLILFDIQSQRIVTILSSETNSGNRVNIVTGTEDSLDNYPTNMTAVIWYIKK